MAQPTDSERFRDERLLELVRLFQGRQKEDEFENGILNPVSFLKDLVNQNPDEYKVCILGEDASYAQVAIPIESIDKDTSPQHIYLDKKLTLSHGFHFVVKIIESPEPNKFLGIFKGRLMEKPPYDMKTKAELIEKLEKKPEKYKICRLQLDGPQLGWAYPLSSEDPIQKIQLKGRGNCGRACQEDEVIVKILEIDDNGVEAHGAVVGVWRQKDKLKYKLFVCEVIEDYGTLMRPLCSSFPKIGYDNRLAINIYHRRLSYWKQTSLLLEKQAKGMLSSADGITLYPHEYANRNLVSVYRPVEDNSHDGIQFANQQVQRVRKHDCEMLFIVCFEEWPIDRWYPRGKVVHIISKEQSFLETIDLIQVINSVPPSIEMEGSRMTQQTIAIEKRVKQKVNIKSEKREDFRDHSTVTIDNRETRDMDDAISLFDDEKGKLIIGVHITDVTEFVGEGSPIDEEARLRGTTYYPNKRARQMGARTNHMLPPQLAEKSLSLLEGQVRRCLSVVFNLKADGQVDSWRPCLTLIRSDKRLNKEDVQRVLLGETDSVEPRIAQMLLRLWSVTRQWRIERLGQAAFVRQKDEPYPETSALVEELMIAANCKVGEYLQQRLDSVPAYPIRVQQRPREIDVTQWMKKHGQRAQHSAELSRALKLVGKEVPSSNIPFQMHNEDAESLRAFCQRGDKRGALSLLFDERRFPHLRLAISDWHGLCELAQYSECTSDSRLHFSLGKEGYVHFTSPMRRYADLMVHRALRFSLLGNEVPIANSFNIKDVCEHLSGMFRRSWRFQNSCESFEYGEELSKKPKNVLAQISSFDEDGIVFSHEILDHSQKVSRHVQYRLLNLCEKPETDEYFKVRCSWRARILRHSVSEDSRQTEKTRKGSNALKVANKNFMSFFRSPQILRAKAELLEKTWNFDSCSIINQDLIESNLADKQGLAEVYCSAESGGSGVHFFRDFLLGEEVKAQIGAVSSRGMMTPALQLIEICENFSICLAHRRRPADTFEQVARRRSQRVYQDIEEYCDIWQGIVGMESASVSVSNNEAFVICEVPLVWKWDEENKRWLGMFNLTESLCQRRNICFTDSVLSESRKSWEKKLIESIETKKGKQKGVPDVTNAVFKAAKRIKRYAEYVCLRSKMSDEYTWVGHGGILLVYDGLHCRSNRCNDKSAHFCNYVVFHLNEVSPDQVAAPNTVTHATVELIMKFLPIRRHELVLQSLRYNAKRGIAERLVKWDENRHILGVDKLMYQRALQKSNARLFQIRVSKRSAPEKIVPCNEKQEEAIRAAVERQVSLIWGPPGTGKTTTGVMLVYWFAFINNHREDAISNEVESSDEDEENEHDRSETDEVPPENFLSTQDDGFQKVKNRGRVNGRKILSTARTSSSSHQRWQMKEVRRRKSRRQILCCGPSNRSVDVIFEASRDLLASQCPSMVRVYSEQVERMYYPVPGEIATADEVAPAIRKFALHELIRSEDSDDAYIICGFDLAFKIFIGSDSEPPVSMEEALRQASAKFSRFARYIRNQRLRSKRRGALELVEEEAGEDALVQGCIKLYKDVVLKSKERVLQNFEVVLCTTSVSCSTILQRACRFVQIIIDEAGMCTQPELLVPIVGRLNVEIDVPSCLGVAPRTINVKPASEFAERVVLIGDHKQLAPIIQNKTAAELGLSKTFFEMHCLDSVMLNHQYRMHPSLADFPSKRFYTAQDSGGLRTQPSVSWTGVHESETQTLNNAKWTGLNWHRLRKLDLFDSRLANGVRHHGLLTQRNANVLHGCWPGVRRDKPFDTLRDVGVEDFHPMGEEERIVFLHVQGREERTLVATEDGREDSYKNELEIDTVIRVYKEIHSRLSGPDKKDPRRCVAVMSQYRYQVSEIKRRLEAEQLPMPTVSTVIACQGSEFGYVLLSLVRSMPDYDIEANPLPGWERKFLGFITDENQTNVALTRAQRGLIIVGNKKLLSRDPNWSHLIYELQQRGCIPKSAADFPNKTGDKRAMTRAGRF